MTRTSCLVLLTVALSIDIFIYLAQIWIGSIESKPFSRFNLFLYTLRDLLQRLVIGYPLFEQPVRQ